MPELGEQYGRNERDLGLIRDSFVREFLGQKASSEKIAEVTNLLVHYEQKLINEGMIELHDEA